ncbi:MAG: hypothetical protein RIC38_10855, partial [Chromatocurvus sp.]
DVPFSIYLPEWCCFMKRGSNSDIPESLGFEIQGPGRRYYDDVVLDNVVDALLEMAANLWMVRDRQFVLEKVLSERGEDMQALIESYVSDPDETARRHMDCDDMVQQIFRSFVRRPTAESGSDANKASLRPMEDSK